MLARVLQRHTKLNVEHAKPGDTIRPGNIYLANSELHLTITDESTFSYVDGRKIRYVLSSANPLFISTAASLGPRTIAVVLTGAGSDGTDGVQGVKANGGIVIAQNQATSEYFGMPGAAIGTGAVDYVLPLNEIAPMLIRLVSQRYQTAEQQS